jgi:hypothetical protein
MSNPVKRTLSLNLSEEVNIRPNVIANVPAHDLRVGSEVVSSCHLLKIIPWRCLVHFYRGLYYSILLYMLVNRLQLNASFIVAYKVCR